jgi:hypothetical protein
MSEDAKKHSAGARRRGPRRRGRGGTSGRNLEGGDAVCAVCVNPLRFVCVGECNHAEVCSNCTLRSRLLLKDRCCPICKTDLASVVVVAVEAAGGGLKVKSYESFDLWGDFNPKASIDDRCGMIFFDCKDHFGDMMRLSGNFCAVQGCTDRGEGEGGVFHTRDALSLHLTKKHQLQFCRLCLEHRPLFTSEQATFTTAALRRHEQGLTGHPPCRFCRNSRFFDAADLFRHMNANHITCHLCPQEHQHRYFRNARQLRDHLRIRHFLCEESPCKEDEHMNAFGTAEELSEHLQADHRMRVDRIPISVGFSVRGSTNDVEDDLRDGVVVEPPPPTSPESSASAFDHYYQQPLPTSGSGWARAAGARPSPSRGRDGEDFPSLPAPTVAQARVSELSLVGRPKTKSLREIMGQQQHQQPPPLPPQPTEAAAVEDGRARRNLQLAEALGLAGPSARAGEVLSNRVHWPKDLVLWAREKPYELSRIEKQIEAMLKDPLGTSISLKPMSRPQRRLAHELAEMYGLRSVSFDPEPKRYVSIKKDASARIPVPLLSEAAKDRTYDISAALPPRADDVERMTAAVMDLTTVNPGDDEEDGTEAPNGKWSRSVLRGQLVRPQGQVTFGDEKAAREAEIKRQQEERRKEIVAQRQAALEEKRALQAGRIDAHRTQWEGLMSDSDDDDDDDDDDGREDGHSAPPPDGPAPPDVSASAEASEDAEDEWEVAADIIQEPSGDGTSAIQGSADGWDDEPIIPAKSKVLAPSSFWHCDSCTYRNPDKARQCEICHADRLEWTVVS